jgi:hypothetical protein
MHLMRDKLGWKVEYCRGDSGPYSQIRASATRKGQFVVKGNVIDAI